MVRMIKKPEIRRCEIVTAAQELFLEKEYEKTTLQDVMKKLSIAKGTIYHYFNSKEELLEAVVEKMSDEYVAGLAATKGTAIERMHALMRASSGKENERLHKSGNIGLHARLLALTISKMAPLYAEVIRQGCEEGVFKTKHPLEAAEVLLAGIQLITDVGFYPWSQEDLMRRTKSIPALLEMQLGAAKGSFQTRHFNHVSGKYFKIDDAEIYCEVIGEEKNPALLFLHGALGNIENFNEILPTLPDRFRIIGIDCRGHGKSSLGSKELTYELLQKDVEIILKKLNVNQLTIIGFSNGGVIAYRLAAFSHLKIDKLITIGAPWCTKHSEHLVEPFSKLTSEIWKKQCPTDFDSYQRLNSNPNFDALFKQAIQMALDPTPTGRPNESVKNITCPLLMVRGENDPIVSHENLVELSKLVKNAQILNIPNAGHEAFLDEMCITKLNEYLS